MEWQYIWATLIFGLIGYLIGSISSAIIVSKIFVKEDIRTKGSGNAGATNTLRNYGWKLGLLVFWLDALKVIVSVLIAWSIKKYSGAEWVNGISLQAVGVAVIIGQIWPIYFGFKGGKGAACTFGYVLLMSWPVALMGFVAFVATIKLSKKVSLGSLVAATIVIPVQILFALIPVMSESWSFPIMNEDPWWVNTIFLLVIDIIVIIKHIPNIKRLIKGNERTVGK